MDNIDFPETYPLTEPSDPEDMYYPTNGRAECKACGHEYVYHDGYRGCCSYTDDDVGDVGDGECECVEFES